MLAEELLVQERPTTMAETTPREIRAIPLPERPTKASSVPGAYARAALIKKNAEREDKMFLLRLAIVYARGHNLGSRATISTGLFPCLSKNVLHNALKGTSKLVDEEARHIGTN